MVSALVCLIVMSEVESDLEALREEWTPKQTVNWENHGSAVLDGLEKLAELAEEKDVEVDIESAQEWYLRTYRPKKRGDGMMERDHVQIGTPEHYFKKFMGKLGNPWGSFQGLVMASFGISEETREEVEDAATTVFVARQLSRGALGKAELARNMREHEKVGELYGH